MCQRVGSKSTYHDFLCHSWQDRDSAQITAMTFSVLLLAASRRPSAVEAVRLVLHDGPGPQRPPASHFEDPRFHAPLSQ